MKYINSSDQKGRNDGVLMQDDDLFIKHERNIVSDLRLITGGKGPPTTSNDWLSPLPEMSVFLMKDRTNPQNYVLMRMQVVAKYDGGGVLLYENITDKPYGVVDPVRFCAQWSVQQILYQPTQEEQEDGERNRITPDASPEG